MLRQSALLPLLLTFLTLVPLLAYTHPFYRPYHREHSSSSSSSSQEPAPLTGQTKQQQQEQQQIPFQPRQNLQQQQHSFEPPAPKGPEQKTDPWEDPQFTHQVGQDRPDEVLTLRHVLHHGGTRYPTLFRRLDVSPAELFLNEVLTGESMTHRIKVKTTTTVKPKGEQFKSFRSRGFRAMGINQDQSFGPESYERQLVNAPDVTDQETLVQLAKMNYNSYTEVASPGWYDLEGNWGVNSTFGWEKDGVRGHVFASKDNSTLIIAIKGTSAAFLGGGGSTAARDKTN
ncbi:putative lipase atg15, partial [Mortierella sp. NVP85]